MSYRNSRRQTFAKLVDWWNDFNQTLKVMLRKTAVQEGKDWDLLIPYVLFAYREVPQSSTGFSPFELLYGREVKGPLDIVKETWEASERSNQSVVSYVVSIREKLGKMAGLVRENLEKAQQAQKAWYNHNARQRGFKKGDSVLVLLHTSNNPLLARWQGPYKVIKPVAKVNYCVDMHDRCKHRRDRLPICKRGRRNSSRGQTSRR